MHKGLEWAEEVEEVEGNEAEGEEFEGDEVDGFPPAPLGTEEVEENFRNRIGANGMRQVTANLQTSV